MQSQYQGYQQPAQPVQPAPQPQTVQELKFYKSSFISFRSAAGKFQADQKRMRAQGWSVGDIAFVGTNFWLQRVIAVVYERQQ